MSTADVLAELAEDLTKEAEAVRRSKLIGAKDFAAGMDNAVQSIQARLAEIVPLKRAGLEVAA
jgi:hypothetical protein